jgi:hypothetical protein
MEPSASSDPRQLQGLALEEDNTGGTSDTETRGSVSPSKREIASLSNPIHGLVEGVGRGNQLLGMTVQKFVPLPGLTTRCRNESSSPLEKSDH